MGCDQENVDRTPLIKPVIGVSQCLLGEAVRYDGGDNRMPWVADVLSSHCEFLALCPELEAGLGVPRARIRLSGTREHPQALWLTDPEQDITLRLQAASEKLLKGFGRVDGVILKACSPSCGPREVPVVGIDGGITSGKGVFAEACLSAWPGLPITDEMGLKSEAQRVAFLIGVFRYHCHRLQRDPESGVPHNG